MQTQLGRPSLFEAYSESIESIDTHWTATLSKIGMTRISNRAVKHAYCTALNKMFPNVFFIV